MESGSSSCEGFVIQTRVSVLCLFFCHSHIASFISLPFYYPSLLLAVFFFAPMTAYIGVCVCVFGEKTGKIKFHDGLSMLLLLRRYTYVGRVGLQHRKCGSFSCKNRNRHKKQKKIVNVIFLRFGRYEIAFWSSSTYGSRKYGNAKSRFFK